MILACSTRSGEKAAEYRDEREISARLPNTASNKIDNAYISKIFSCFPGSLVPAEVLGGG